MNVHYRPLCLATFAVICRLPVHVTSQPLIYNNHMYELYAASGLSYSRADAVAQTKMQCRTKGHLVSITDQAEQDAVAAWARPIMTSSAAWIGLDNLQNGSFQWTTGESASYLNWKVGEPNEVSRSWQLCRYNTNWIMD